MVVLEAVLGFQNIEKGRIFERFLPCFGLFYVELKKLYSDFETLVRLSVIVVSNLFNK